MRFLVAPGRKRIPRGQDRLFRMGNRAATAAADDLLDVRRIDGSDRGFAGNRLAGKDRWIDLVEVLLDLRQRLQHGLLKVLAAKVDQRLVAKCFALPRLTVPGSEPRTADSGFLQRIHEQL